MKARIYPQISFNQQSPADAFIIGLIPFIVTPLSRLKKRPRAQDPVVKEQRQ